MEINQSERKRGFLLFIMFSIWVLGICFALIKIQVLDYAKNINKVRAQSNRTITLHSKRGTIYDCHGDVLAISVKAQSAFIKSKDKTETFRLFNTILGKGILLTESEKRIIRSRIGKGDKFIWLKRKLSDDEYKLLKEVKLSSNENAGLDFVEEYMRVYPQNTIACHILGGVGMDEQGLFGIEYTLNSVVSGKGGIAKVVQDARQKIFDLQYEQMPEPGKDVYLTIDSSIQFFVEQELEKTVNSFQAKSGTVIVMNSQDASILAMACYPNYHPGYVSGVPARITRNNAISFLYHPGSTFKVILASTALEKNICSPQQQFNCFNGSYHFRNLTITDVHPYASLSFEDIIIYSSNIGAARIGELLGKQAWYDGIQRFGFGKRVGIRLTGEESGIVHPLSSWSGVSLEFLAHGYELAVTPLQMIRAFNVLASGGYLMAPSIVKEIDGVYLKNQEAEKILSPATVQRMIAIMTEVVNRGTAKSTQIPGIEIAGKTGTTKIIRRSSKEQSGNQYIASFGGFFPAKNPRVTIFVVMEEPKGQYYGGDVAAPLFKSIAEKLLIYLKIFPEMDNKNEISL